jgi:regulator of replication initiation timing
MEDCGMTQAMDMIETLNQEHDAVLTENAKLLAENAKLHREFHRELEEYKKLIKKISVESHRHERFVDTQQRYQSFLSCKNIQDIIRTGVISRPNRGKNLSGS